jgi:hypothetical protein
MEEYYSDNEGCFSCKSEFTNVILNEELKQLVYKEIVTAQNPNSPFALAKLKKYDMYHEELEKYFIKNCGKKPSQTDNLAFILLLTYPKEMIERFTNFNNLKLAFNNKLEESDFESKGFTKYASFGFATCICNEDIMWVHNFRNKYSGISIQIGSVCNKRYGLISPKDPNFKSDCKLIKEYKERQKEIQEGLPIGYYEELRKVNNELKLKEKMEKELKKKLQEQEKLLRKKKQQEEKNEKKEKKQEKQEEKLMGLEDSYTKRINSINHYKNCILCKKEGLYSKYSKLTVCYNCVSSSIRIKKKLINDEVFKKKREYKVDECLNCENNFTYRYRGVLKYFCNNCEKTYKKLRCNLCTNEFIDDINSKDIFCNICDEKVKECLDCKNKFISESQTIMRCDKCQYRFSYKIKVKNCQQCDDEFEIKETENWKTFCSDCFKYSLQSVICPGCNSMFKKLPNQSWKKTCTDCYYKSK